MFDGVKKYIMAKTTVSIGFPVDLQGKQHICCDFCDMFSGRICKLTGEIVLYPDKYTGHECPLEFIEECDDDV